MPCIPPTQRLLPLTRLPHNYLGWQLGAASHKCQRNFTLRPVASILTRSPQALRAAPIKHADSTEDSSDPTAAGQGPTESTLAPLPKTTPTTLLPSPVVLLFLVSLLWGTYSPALRFLYTIDHPPTPALLTALRTVISAATLVMLSQATRPAEPIRNSVDQGPKQHHHSQMLWAGAELGLYNFLGTALQAAGLQATTSTKGAFLGQLTAVITPMLAVLFGERVGPVTWAACCLGMVGGVMMTLDDTTATAAEGAVGWLSDVWGPAAILAGCVFYGLTTVRLSQYAPRYEPLQLASSKVMFLAVLSVMWYAADAVGTGSSGSVFLREASSSAWLVLVFSAVAPGALAALLQTTAQAKVSATQAQVIFACTPLWSAVIGMALLHEEGLGDLAVLGGTIIMAATLLTSWQMADEP